MNIHFNPMLQFFLSTKKLVSKALSDGLKTYGFRNNNPLFSLHPEKLYNQHCVPSLAKIHIGHLSFFLNPRLSFGHHGCFKESRVRNSMNGTSEILSNKDLSLVFSMRERLTVLWESKKLHVSVTFFLKKGTMFLNFVCA